MSSIIKVDTVQDTDGNNIINENANTITIGASGDTISIPAGATLANNGTATGFAAIDWQSTVVTGATHTASANQGIWINTTSNACTLTLPSSPSVGDQLIFSDFARSWATNAVTLSLNGSKFQGNTSPAPVYDTTGETVQIVYSGSTKGWIPINDGAVALETPQTTTIDYLVIAGAGGGGGVIGGGGGAGGMISATSVTVQKGSSFIYTATIGAGNTGADQGGTGTNTTLAGSGLPSGTTITAIGGGNGGSHDVGNNAPGADGGSGGGGGANASSGTNSGGSGTSGQGNDGGSANNDNYGGGGGGKGGNGSSSFGCSANGGTSSSNSITGSAVDYAGGGAGGSRSGFPTASGGGGGAGNGGNYPSNNGGDATANTGSGGGGPTGNGASGVVIIRIPTADYSGTTTGSPTVTTDGSDTVIKFTGTGTLGG